MLMRHRMPGLELATHSGRFIERMTLAPTEKIVPAINYPSHPLGAWWWNSLKQRVKIHCLSFGVSNSRNMWKSLRCGRNSCAFAGTRPIAMSAPL